MTPFFRRIGDGPILALEPSVGVGWIGFLWRGSQTPTRLSLPDAWASPGVYLFLASAPEGDGQLTSAVAGLENPDEARCIWLGDVQSRELGAISALWAVPTGDGGAVDWRLTRPARFEHGSYHLQVEDGALLRRAGAPWFGISAQAGAVRFGRGELTYRATGPSRVTFVGAAAGGWQVSLILPGVDDDFAALAVELRYSGARLPSTKVGGPGIVRMPVFRQEGRRVRTNLSFDPLRPEDPARTYVGFKRGTRSMLSGFVTTDGHDVHLAPFVIPGTESARLVFCHSMSWSPAGALVADAYLTPHGPFLLRTAGGPGRLQVGPSGVESVEVGTSKDGVMLFRAGRPAFAPGTGPDLLTALATTAHATVLAPEGAIGFFYRAQPPSAPLFREGPGQPLRAAEVISGQLPTRGEAAGCPTFPIGAYRWLDPDAAADAIALERIALAPLRRDRIPGAGSLAGDLAGDERLVTPQGFVIELSESGRSQIKIGSLPGADPATLMLTDVRGQLASALQADQAFVVIRDPSIYFDGASIRYRLEQAQIERLPIPARTREALTNALGPQYREYETEAQFASVAEQPAGTSWDLVRRVAGRLIADLDGWRMDLSPRAWRTDEMTGTVMLIKFADSTLASLVADPARWSWPEAAGDKVATQALIEGMFAAAAAAPPGSDLAAFSAEVVTDANWNGVLVLNAPILLPELPAELRFALAGTESRPLFAHHVALTLTAVGRTTTETPAAASAISALIAYADPTDLVMSDDRPAAFKANRVSARFANGGLIGFTAELELLLNRLFGAVLRKLSPDRGNNLLLDGTYQLVQGVPLYQFSLRSVNEYVVADSALELLAVSAVRLETNTPGGSGIDFVLSGTFGFRELPGADVFSFDRLRYANLRIQVRDAPDGPTWVVDDAALTFDRANSRARRNSLVRRFPARIARLLSSAAPSASEAGQTPQKLGYAPVLAPVNASGLEPPWYGLAFTVDLGSSGSLGGDVPLSVELLAAWAPGKPEAEPPVYLGARATGALGGGWSLQGVLRLGFKSFQLLVDDIVNEGAVDRAYGLRLGRFALTAMGASFPPGRADLFLFGDPEGDPSAALGWYAGYAQPMPDAKKP